MQHSRVGRIRGNRGLRIGISAGGHAAGNERPLGVGRTGEFPALFEVAGKLSAHPPEFCPRTVERDSGSRMNFHNEFVQHVSLIEIDRDLQN